MHIPLSPPTAYPPSRVHVARPFLSRLPFGALSGVLPTLFGALVILAVWQGIVSLQLYPQFIIPAPRAVFERFTEILLDGRLWLHFSTTLLQTLIGGAVGLSAALILGYALAKNRLLDRGVSPVLAAVQAIPVVAYAPLLVIWFGTGAMSKIVTCTLIVFFPMLLNTILGIRSVPPALRDLMRSLQATRWQMFTRLEIPAALPILFSGLRVSTTLAVIGVVVGEFISADAGLGYLIKLARQGFDTPLVFVAMILLALLARLIYGAVSLLETRALRWQLLTSNR